MRISPFPGPDKIGFVLILISSVLLGIWATMHTIALRNILLGFGGLGAIYYWAIWLKSLNKHSFEMGLPRFAWAPMVLVVLMLLWVVIHFFCFSVDPQRQLSELSSTWVRALLAVLIGSATGLVLIRNAKFAPWLWLGLIVSFLILIGQYIPKALQRGSIFGVDFFGGYIYWAKFNGVLAGTILIAGLLGLLIDCFRNDGTQGATQGAILPPWVKASHLIPVYSLFGIFLAAYSFVFIFDAKAGVGLAVILIGFWILVGLGLLAIKILRLNKQKNLSSAYIKLAGLFFLIVLALGFLSYKHVKNNPGWERLFSDIAISAKIDQYSNWQNPHKYGYPQRGDGTTVAGNTYERVSWATVGLRLIGMQPLGNGLFRSFPEQVKKLAPEFSDTGIVYTHSAWIDLGLAFGLGGLILTPLALLIAMLRAVMGLSGRYKATIITLSLATLILYSVGEYAFQQGVEMLFYLSGLVGGLSLVASPKK